MAYMSQEHKVDIAAVVKPILKKYGLKGSLSVHHHSTLVLTVKSGEIDFISNYNEARTGRGHILYGEYYIQVNVYHYEKQFTGKALDFLKEVVPAMYGPRYFDKSDMMSDYYYCSHYVSVNIGKWNQPYAVVGKEK